MLIAIGLQSVLIQYIVTVYSACSKFSNLVLGVYHAMIFSWLFHYNRVTRIYSINNNSLHVPPKYTETRIKIETSLNGLYVF